MESQKKQTINMNSQSYFSEYTDSSLPNHGEVEAVNTSCNHNGAACIFDGPECVIDIYLEAINGGTSMNDKFRSISQRYGQEESDFNCNSNSQQMPPGYCGGCTSDPCYDSAKNVDPEPLPNQGCGCSFSYNGGAGAGTADCGGCDSSAYDNGINDKKRAQPCACSAPSAQATTCGSECPYQKELCNKKAMSSCCTGLSEVEYKPEDVNNKPVLPSCCCEGGPYEKDLVNKKPSICSPCGPEFHPPCEPKKQCQLGEYVTRRSDIPDRRCFYSDEECGNTTVLRRCDNSL